MVATSNNEAEGPWKNLDAHPVSPEQNPGAFMLPNGSVWMYYRAQASGVGPCSGESIGMSMCLNATAPCVSLANPVFKHTSEDPSVFQDHRGNYHMLTNALPGGCNPKVGKRRARIHRRGRPYPIERPLYSQSNYSGQRYFQSVDIIMNL